MRLGSYEMLVQVNDRPVTEYLHEGNIFIEGRKKSNYKIILKNHSNRKVAGIVSVDGLSVIDGKPAGIKSQGYLIYPYCSVIIDGWRTSQNNVNEFKFSSISKSYAERSLQTTNNVGVIGAMFLKEKEVAFQNYYNNTLTTTLPNSLPYAATFDTTGKYIPNPSYGICGAVNVSDTTMSCTASVGTGFGESVLSPSYEENINLEEYPDEILCVYYDDRKGLERRGIVLDATKLYPKAFPNYSEPNKYVKFPVK